MHGIPQAKVDGLVGKGMGLYDLRRPSVRCLWALAALHTNFNQALGRSTSKDERRAHHRALGEEEGNSLTLGADVSFSAYYYLDSDVLSSTSAIACFSAAGVGGNSGQCQILTLDETTISAGTAVAISALNYDIDHTEVVALDASNAILCNMEWEGSNSPGKCRHLSVTGTTISVGAELLFNPGDTQDADPPGQGSQFLALAKMDTSRAILCYSDGARCVHCGSCNLITVDGTSLTKGQQVEITALDTHTSFNSVARLDSSSAILCFFGSLSTGYAVDCIHLTVGGTSGTDLTAGSPVKLLDLSTHSAVSGGGVPVVAALDSSSAVVCYDKADFGAGGSNGYQTCNHLTVTGTTLSAGEDFYHGEADLSGQTFRTIMPVDASRAIVCHNDRSLCGTGSTDHQQCLRCTLLSVDGTSLTTSGTDLVVAGDSVSTYWEKPRSLSIVAIDAPNALLCYLTWPDGKCAYITIPDGPEAETSGSAGIAGDPHMRGGHGAPVALEPGVM